MARNWTPCRVCGADHTNPSSSGICPPCGAEERAARERAQRDEQQEYEASEFGQFMSLSEDERWQRVFELIVAIEAA